MVEEDGRRLMCLLEGGGGDERGRRVAVETSMWKEAHKGIA